MRQSILELVEVTKVFRGNWTLSVVRAVDRLSLAAREGEIYGLIGHNGAGKTTTFKLLVGLLRPTSGKVLCEGQPLSSRVRQSMGFSPEQPYFYDYLTVRETLHFYGQLYGLSTTQLRSRIAAVVAQFGIAHKLHAPMRTLSKGLLQRVAVAQAIMHQPRLVILDEPMSGLDPAGRKSMRDLILSLKRSGTTVLFSSHVLSDAEALCDRVAILAAGRLREVVDLHRDGAVPISYALVVARPPAETLEALARIAMLPPAGGPERWTIKLNDHTAVRSALAAIHGTDTQVEAVLPEYPSLEDRFLQYTRNGDLAD
jgi:ABC-2 type transport system ATP-binding protein